MLLLSNFFYFLKLGTEAGTFHNTSFENAKTEDTPTANRTKEMFNPA